MRTQQPRSKHGLLLALTCSFTPSLIAGCGIAHARNPPDTMAAREMLIKSASIPHTAILAMQGGDSGSPGRVEEPTRPQNQGGVATDAEAAERARRLQELRKRLSTGARKTPQD
jgi:hypothetical protein